MNNLLTLRELPIVLFAALIVPFTGQALDALVTFPTNSQVWLSRQLSQGPDGSFYGTTTYGGTNGQGSIFKVSPEGSLITLFSFDLNTSGMEPEGGLVLGNDGNYYGVTGVAPGLERGTVFRITPEGSLTTLFVFEGHDNGALPRGLKLGHDGHFYGVTDSGAIFRITTEGVFAKLTEINHSPIGLIQASDDNFFVTTYAGGTHDLGAIFKLTPEGELTNLASFTGTNGARPGGELREGLDGHFYGVTTQGGPNNLGTIYRMTADGTIITLVSFNGSNGSRPQCELLQTKDGTYYGTTYLGGVHGYGTVFRMTPDGVLTTLYSFPDEDAGGPVGLFTPGDGNFYVTARGNYNGRIYRLFTPIKSLRTENELILSWPANTIGATLQSAAVLTPPVVWTDYTNTPAVWNGTYVVTNSISGEGRLYRLKQ